MGEASGASEHPLDRAVWNALATRRSVFSVGDARARRLRCDIGLFAAAADKAPDSLTALSELVSQGRVVGMIEPDAWPAPSGCVAVDRKILVQMVAPGLTSAPNSPDVVALTTADAPAMFDLATRTRPGPFFANTHLFGGFVGIKRDGALIAMAGTRLALPGYVEVSGVCTHADHRGHGLGATLIQTVAHNIRSAGDTPFLTSYADNAGAIALYEKLGFRIRRELFFTTFERG